MQSSISSLTIMPKMKESELATSDPSRFYPMALITKPWLIGLSSSLILTPTVYYVVQNILN